MSDLGKARPASHQNLSEKFGGLLARVEVPELPTAAASPTVDETTVPEISTAPASSRVAVATPAIEITTHDAQTLKKAPRRKAAGVKQTQTVATPAPLPVPAKDHKDPETMSKTHRGITTDEKADQPVQISLPSSIEARLAKFKSETGLSHPNILFDAIEATADRLPALVKAKTIQLGSATGVSLFNRPQTAVKRDVAHEPKKTFIIRITKQNKGIVDELVKQVEAPNRNVLIVTAYDTYLPTD
jgi:hypothetical protein